MQLWFETKSGQDLRKHIVVFLSSDSKILPHPANRFQIENLFIPKSFQVTVPSQPPSNNSGNNRPKKKQEFIIYGMKILLANFRATFEEPDPFLY